MNMQQSPEAAAAALISRATLPKLIVDKGDLPASVRAIADLLSKTGKVYNQGGFLVRIHNEPGEAVRAVPVTHHAATMWAHELCRPVSLDDKGHERPVTFPERGAKMLVDAATDQFPPLDGIATTPLLADDGTIRCAEGYDPATRLYCARAPRVSVPERPSRLDAEAALLKLRAVFETFPYADSQRITACDLDVVDLTQPPGEAESAFLAALLTAICRPSLTLAPGAIITAPEISGAGSGKGLLIQAITVIAYGQTPPAFTAGTEKGELEKRIASELLQSGPAFFLDNVNGTALKSDTLASVITERPARVRVFGETRMAELNSTAWIAITGNGLSISEDLARRFLAVELDPKCDDPEARDFPEGRDGFLANIKARRAELLSAALTIWRWGRQNEMQRGKPLGSFETWASWVRDPLITLGCCDPVEAIAKAKARDPFRLRVSELFEAWWQEHRTAPIKIAELHDSVRAIADPQGRGRQYVATFIGKLSGTRAAGFVLTRQEASGKWGSASYQLRKIST
ncbi:MAG: hypothetical protein KGJ73_02345 [Rhodospirillales bacterium]|nr:hypothetical protein [Rhodospirillales bacterium]